MRRWLAVLLGVAVLVAHVQRRALIQSLPGVTALVGSGPLEVVSWSLVIALVAACLWRGQRHIRGASRWLVGRFDAADRILFGWLPDRLQQRVAGILTGLIVAIVVLPLAPLHQMRQLENVFVDAFFNLMFPVSTRVEGVEAGSAEAVSGNDRIRDDIFIVAIDNDTIYRYGWPLPRHLYADLIDVLAGGGAASIGFDVLFIDESAEHPEWDEAVGAAAARADNTFFAFSLEPSGSGATLSTDESTRIGQATAITGDRLTPDLPRFAAVFGGDVAPDFVIAAIAAGAAGVGIVNTQPDADDGILRRAVMLGRVGERAYPSLALAIAARNISGADLQVRGHSVRLAPGIDIPIDEDGLTAIRFVGRPGETFPIVSMHRVLKQSWSFKLPHNPIDPGLEFAITEQTRLSLRGAPLDRPRRELLHDGIAVRGRLIRSADNELEVVDLDLDPDASDETAAYEMAAADTLAFRDRVADVAPPGVPAAVFRDKHVLVGSTATGAYDKFVTAIGPIQGVEVQASVLNSLLNGDSMRRPGRAAQIVLVLTTGVVVGILATMFVPVASTAVFAFLLLAMLLALHVAFRAGLQFGIAQPVLTAFVTFFLVFVYRLRAERRGRVAVEESRAFITSLFGRYVSDSIVETLLGSHEALRLGGERRRVTIVMSDLRGFTSLSARLQPEEVVDILNNYLGAMTEIIMRYEGTIDEFIGDAILVAFGAPIRRPDDEARAIACAIEMQRAMLAVNAWNREHGYPDIEMGIGVNTGDLVVGNIGSKHRAKYAFVGTTINMCARIESYTVGGQVIISQSTHDAAANLVDVESVMQVTPKGLKEPISIYLIRGIGGPYAVSLPHIEEDLLALADPIRVQCFALAGKDVASEGTDGTIIALAEKSADMQLAQPLEEHSNVKLVLFDGSDAIAGDVYAKVLVSSDERGVARLRFTSVPERPQEFLADSRGKAQAGGVAVFGA